MLFSNIDNETKMEILQENLFKYEKDVYENLIKLAINPESFDLAAFSKEDFIVDINDLGTLASVENLAKAIDAMAMINAEVSSLG